MKSNEKLSARVFCGVLVLMCSGAIALAQNASKDEYPKVEVFAGYSGLGEAGSRGISFGADRRVGGNYSAKPGFETSTTWRRPMPLFRFEVEVLPPR